MKRIFICSALVCGLACYIHIVSGLSDMKNLEAMDIAKPNVDLYDYSSDNPKVVNPLSLCGWRLGYQNEIQKSVAEMQESGIFRNTFAKKFAKFCESRGRSIADGAQELLRQNSAGNRINVIGILRELSESDSCKYFSKDSNVTGTICDFVKNGQIKAVNGAKYGLGGSLYYRDLSKLALGKEFLERIYKVIGNRNAFVEDFYDYLFSDQYKQEIDEELFKNSDFVNFNSGISCVKDANTALVKFLGLNAFFAPAKCSLNGILVGCDRMVQFDKNSGRLRVDIGRLSGGGLMGTFAAYDQITRKAAEFVLCYHQYLYEELALRKKSRDDFVQFILSSFVSDNEAMKGVNDVYERLYPAYNLPNEEKIQEGAIVSAFEESLKLPRTSPMKLKIDASVSAKITFMIAPYIFERAIKTIFGVDMYEKNTRMDKNKNIILATTSHSLVEQKQKEMEEEYNKWKSAHEQEDEGYNKMKLYGAFRKAAEFADSKDFIEKYRRAVNNTAEVRSDADLVRCMGGMADVVKRMGNWNMIRYVFAVLNEKFAQNWDEQKFEIADLVGRLMNCFAQESDSLKIDVIRKICLSLLSQDPNIRNAKDIFDACLISTINNIFDDVFSFCNTDGRRYDAGAAGSEAAARTNVLRILNGRYGLMVPGNIEYSGYDAPAPQEGLFYNYQRCANITNPEETHKFVVQTFKSLFNDFFTAEDVDEEIAKGTFEDESSYQDAVVPILAKYAFSQEVLVDRLLKAPQFSKAANAFIKENSSGDDAEIAWDSLDNQKKKQIALDMLVHYGYVKEPTPIATNSSSQS
ncbi:hypothetical protein FACS1894122_02510 [Alphaproteobacteria bacterium]|nr:hypothetical protein FACS1894122_02510 [Alphaproteobacteria bacterium]